MASWGRAEARSRDRQACQAECQTDSKLPTVVQGVLLGNVRIRRQVTDEREERGRATCLPRVDLK